MRYRLKTDVGMVITCSSPECVRLWLERGAELADPRDLELLAQAERERRLPSSLQSERGGSPVPVRRRSG